MNHDETSAALVHTAFQGFGWYPLAPTIDFGKYFQCKLSSAQLWEFPTNKPEAIEEDLTKKHSHPPLHDCICSSK